MRAYSNDLISLQYSHAAYKTCQSNFEAIIYRKMRVVFLVFIAESIQSIEPYPLLLIIGTMKKEQRKILKKKKENEDGERQREREENNI